MLKLQKAQVSGLAVSVLDHHKMLGSALCLMASIVSGGFVQAQTYCDVEIKRFGNSGEAQALIHDSNIISNSGDKRAHVFWPRFLEASQRHQENKDMSSRPRRLGDLRSQVVTIQGEDGSFPLLARSNGETIRFGIVSPEFREGQLVFDQLGIGSESYDEIDQLAIFTDYQDCSVFDMFKSMMDSNLSEISVLGIVSSGDLRTFDHFVTVTDVFLRGNLSIKLPEARNPLEQEILKMLEAVPKGLMGRRAVAIEWQRTGRGLQPVSIHSEIPQFADVENNSVTKIVALLTGLILNDKVRAE